MKTYVFIALLLMLGATHTWAQSNSGFAYQHSYRNKPEGASEQILVKTFPNPFQEQIHFQFELTDSSPVNLTVFDITGKKVAVLVDGMLEKDTYKLNWKPSQLLSGMYIYVFSAGKARKTGKILFLNNHI